MGWGDEVVAAGEAQRIYDAHGRRVEIRDLRGSRRWHPMWEGNPIIVRPEEDVDPAGDVFRLKSGPGCRPYIVYPFDEQAGWTFNTSFKCRDHIAKIYLTPQEQFRGDAARAHYGPYVLIEPFTKHANFRWPMASWAQLVAACRDLTFVQHVHKDSDTVPGAWQEPATFREACGLVAAAEVYVRSESGMCHAAAALGARQVTLFGGCMDADVMGFYPGQTCLVDRGPGSPCGRWLPCPHCAACMARLTVGEVSAALRQRLAERRAA